MLIVGKIKYDTFKGDGILCLALLGRNAIKAYNVQIQNR